MQQQPDVNTPPPRRVLELTQSLTSLVLTLPEELTEELDQAVTFVSQFLS